MNKQKLLITGADGFIGRNLVKATSWYYDLVSVPEENPEILLHQAANNDTLDMDREAMSRSNVEEPKVLFQKCLDNGCKQFVFAYHRLLFMVTKRHRIQRTCLSSP